jgi:isopentenyldiphosphate isomerase
LGKHLFYFIDYILFLKSKKNIPLNKNLEEAEDIMFVNQIELNQLYNDKNLLKTPWFSLIHENGLLKKWWDLMIKGDYELLKSDSDKIFDFTK